jgi:hypothetical protein
MKLKAVLDDIQRLECFGYGPSSSSTKPAHVANGWFRSVLGTRFDPIPLNKTVVHWTRNGEINPSDKLITEYPTTFEAFNPQIKREQFAEFRADLKALVCPVGGSVNDGNRNSAYNITCERHITADSLDLRTGTFLYYLLATDLGTGSSPVVPLLKKILQSSRDEVSTITSPLVAHAQKGAAPPGTYEADSVFRKRGGSFVSPVLRQLRIGFDNLARFESTCGGELDALRRLVSFGVFSVMLHMHNRLGEMEGAAPEPVNPILLYFQERHRTTAYQASHATYNLNRRAIESLYTARLKAWLTARVGKRPSEKKIEDFVKQLEFDSKNGSESTKKDALLRAYRSFASELDDVTALAEALREVLFRGMSGTPLDFYRGLGVRVGFLRPAGNSAVRKYYTLEGVLLEAVLASVLPAGEITYQQLLKELNDRYGLLVGGRPNDFSSLMKQGIGIATVQDLQANSHVFRQHLLSLGWGKSYADGVLMVGVPEGLR